MAKLIIDPLDPMHLLYKQLRLWWEAKHGNKHWGLWKFHVEVKKEIFKLTEIRVSFKVMVWDQSSVNRKFLGKVGMTVENPHIK